VCVDQWQRPRVSELQRAAAFGTQLPSVERQTRGRQRERDWAPRPPITHRPLKTQSVLFSLDVFPNHISSPVQTVFFPSKHPFFINKGLPVRCLIKNSPLTTEVLTTVERFFHSQIKPEHTRKNDSTHFACCVRICMQVFYIFSYLNVFTCDVLHHSWKKFRCILTLGNQLIREIKMKNEASH